MLYFPHLPWFDHAVTIEEALVVWRLLLTGWFSAADTIQHTWHHIRRVNTLRIVSIDTAILPVIVIARGCSTLQVSTSGMQREEEWQRCEKVFAIREWTFIAKYLPRNHLSSRKRRRRHLSHPNGFPDQRRGDSSFETGLSPLHLFNSVDQAPSLDVTSIELLHTIHWLPLACRPSIPTPRLSLLKICAIVISVKATLVANRTKKMKNCMRKLTCLRRQIRFSWTVCYEDKDNSLTIVHLQHRRFLHLFETIVARKMGRWKC